MTRTIYRSIMTVSALMAGALVAAPVWDHYHYSLPTAAGLPTSPTTLALMTGGQAPSPSYPSAEHLARALPSPGSVTAPSPASGNGSGDRQDARQDRMPDLAPNTAHQAIASPAAPAAIGSRPITGRPTIDAAPSPIAASPVGHEAGADRRSESGVLPQQNPRPAADWTASTGWVAGGATVGSRQAPVTTPRTAEPDHVDSGQNDGSRSSATAQEAPAPGDSPPVRLSLSTDRQAVTRGETFSVAVVLTGAQDVTSVPFHLQFDPGILQYVGARTGPALNGRSLQPIFLASVNPGRPGDLAVGLSLVRSSGTFTGSGAVLVLDFRAVAAGRSDLQFDRASVRGPTSEPLPAEIVGAETEVR